MLPWFVIETIIVVGNGITATSCAPKLLQKSRSRSCPATKAKQVQILNVLWCFAWFIDSLIGWHTRTGLTYPNMGPWLQGLTACAKTREETGPKNMKKKKKNGKHVLLRYGGAQ